MQRAYWVWMFRIWPYSKCSIVRLRQVIWFGFQEHSFIQRFWNMHVSWGLQHMASCLFMVSCVCCKQTNGPTVCMARVREGYAQNNPHFVGRRNSLLFSRMWLNKWKREAVFAQSSKSGQWKPLKKSYFDSKKQHKDNRTNVIMLIWACTAASKQEY